MTDIDTRDLFALARGDTALFELFAEYERVYAESNEMMDLRRDDDAERLAKQAAELEERIEAIRPVTLPGVLKMLERGLWLARDIDPPAEHPMLKQAVASLREIAARNGGGGDDKPLTAEQMAAFEFEAINEDSFVAMVHDFSEPKWSTECKEHGVALRFAATLLRLSKKELIDAVDQVETEAGDAPPPGPTQQLNESLRASRDRLKELAGWLDKAAARQHVAAAVLELRYEQEVRS